MLVYVATYPRCGNSFLRHTLNLNWGFKFAPDVQREEMAASDRLFMFKTHGRPLDGYLPGERVVQLVRHPCAANTSEWKVDHEFRELPRPLADFITGKSISGRWDEYHAEWGQAGIPLWRWRYEDAFVDPVSMIENLGGFFGFPPAAPVVFTLAAAHAANPRRNPGRGLNGWRDQITEAEAEWIWQEHGTAASQFGYSFESAAMMRA